jgi:flagellar assembly protein FliH
MSSSPDWRPGKPVLRGGDAQQAARPAAFGVDLRKGVPPDSAAVARVKEEARTAGYAEGWAQGQREAAVAAAAAADQAAAAEQAYAAERAAALQQAVGALARAAAGLDARTAATVEEIQDLVAGYAVELAEAILARELTAESTRGAEAVRRAMSQAPASGAATVSLHPDDYRLLAEAAPDGEFLVDGRAVRLRSDAALRPGDAVAEIGAMTVDATIAAAVARAREALGA